MVMTEGLRDHRAPDKGQAQSSPDCVVDPKVEQEAPHSGNDHES